MNLLSFNSVVLISYSVFIFLSPSWQSNSIVSQNEIIRKMAEWGFEYFKTASLLVEENVMELATGDEVFPLDSFNLITELMEGKRSNWTKEDLIEILRIGDKFMATDESFEKILTTILRAIYENVIEREIVCSFNLLKMKMEEIDSTDFEFGINYSGEQLVMNGTKVHPDNAVKALKYFLIKAQYFNDIVIYGFQIGTHNCEIFCNYLQSRPFFFHSIGKQVVINSLGDVELSPYTLIGHSNFRFIHKERMSILSILDDIPTKSLYGFIALHPKNQILIENLANIFSKMSPHYDCALSGDLPVEQFGIFYTHFRNSLHAISNADSNTCLIFIGRIRLLSTDPTLTMNYESFWYPSKSAYSFPTVKLNLTKKSKSNSENGNLPSMNFSSTAIATRIDSNDDLESLSVALKENCITAFDLVIDNFTNYFKQYDKLFELFKAQKFKTFFLSSYENRNLETIHFFSNLMNTTPFGSELEYLNCSSFPFDTIVQLLNNPMPKLKKLELYVVDFYNEAFTLKPFDSVKELEFFYEVDLRGPSQDILKFIKLFPQLERLVIRSSPNNMAGFGANGVTYKKSYYQSCKIKDEHEFINYLSLLPTLKSVRIISYCGNFEWRKEKDHIYYEFNLKCN